MTVNYTLTDFETRLAELGASPTDNGTVEMIVRRPAIGEREVLTEGEFNPDVGLVGDNWKTRGSRHTEDGSAHPEQQIVIMNSRIIEAIAGDRSRWALAGDELFIDLDLSKDNLPAGQQLAIGSAVLEVTPMPHNGCKKFAERFGSDATKFVNAKEGRAQCRRGICARVVQAGTIRHGDTAMKI